jgi:hypothetical protein
LVGAQDRLVASAPTISTLVNNSAEPPPYDFREVDDAALLTGGSNVTINFLLPGSFGELRFARGAGGRGQAAWRQP